MLHEVWRDLLLSDLHQELFKEVLWEVKTARHDFIRSTHPNLFIQHVY